MLAKLQFLPISWLSAEGEARGVGGKILSSKVGLSIGLSVIEKLTLTGRLGHL